MKIVANTMKMSIHIMRLNPGFNDFSAAEISGILSVVNNNVFSGAKTYTIAFLK